MKRIEDVKEFEDIDTYYEISNIVAEVFKDRVEAPKHLVAANKEIERLNNIINELEKELKQYKYVVDEIQKCLDEYFKSYHRVYEENQVEYDYLVGIENLIGQLKGADKE